MTLTEFLLARIDEDERTYRAELGETEYAEVGPSATLFEWSRRGLADCEVKRRIVDLRASWKYQADLAPEIAGALAKAQVIAADAVLDAVLRALALPYANHPDYREEWKP